MFYSKKTSGGDGDAQNTEILSSAKEYSPDEVFNKIKEFSKERKFVESVEAIVKLNVDPTKGD